MVSRKEEGRDHDIMLTNESKRAGVEAAELGVSDRSSLGRLTWNHYSRLTVTRMQSDEQLLHTPLTVSEDISVLKMRIWLQSPPSTYPYNCQSYFTVPPQSPIGGQALTTPSPPSARTSSVVEVEVYWLQIGVALLALMP